MKPALPREIEVEEIEGGVRYTFPRRNLGRHRWLPWVLLLAGLLLMVGPVAFFLWRALAHGWAHLVAILPTIPLLIGGFWVTVFALTGLIGRARIERRREFFHAADLIGPFKWNRPGKGVEPSALVIECGWEESVLNTKLALKYKGKKDQLLAGGYPADWLKAVAHDLAGRTKAPLLAVQVKRPKRVAGPPPAAGAERPVESRAKVERVEGRLRLDLPARGSTKTSTGMLIFGIVWLAIFTAMPVGLFWGCFSSEGAWEDMMSSFLLAISIYIVPLWFIGPACILSAIAQKRRRGVIEVADGRLTLRQRGILGRTDAWEAGEIASIRCGKSGTRINGMEIMELEIHLENGREIGRLAGRDEAELRWIASVVWRGLKGSEGEAVHAAGGECQVCGGEMGEGVVYCATCATAHHEDCWAYLGKCSTYGCAADRFSRTPAGEK